MNKKEKGLMEMDSSGVIVGRGIREINGHGKKIKYTFFKKKKDRKAPGNLWDYA